jgi:SNF2 family DNA or RNA helicase
MLSATAAHWIRNSNTKQFKAARDLEATRRWCVTGTPIQNSLDDLLSLLKFLHLQPFCQHAVFERDILSPLRSGNPNAFRNLKLLLSTICLRRSSQLLNLQPVKVETVPVTLNVEERKCYKAIQVNCQGEFERITSQQSQLKRYTVLFCTIRQLQRLCSNGQYLAPSFALAEGKKGTSKGKNGARTRVDIECDLCSDQDAAGLLDGLSMCPECSKPLANEKRLSNDTFSMATHLSPGCFLNSIPSPSPSPLSGHYPSSTYFQTTSSKLNAVADNIEQYKDGSKR